MTILNGIDQADIRQLYERYEGSEIIVKGANITADTETINLNIFKITGSIMVVSQFAEITEVTALTNMTDVYADLWDGTNSVELTASPGATMSGLVVGSLFSKDKDSSEIYTISNADECRLMEADRKSLGYPFIVTAKTGADTYIRFNFTTNATLNFKMDVFFRYKIIDGGLLTLA